MLHLSEQTTPIEAKESRFAKSHLRVLENLCEDVANPISQLHLTEHGNYLETMQALAIALSTVS